MSNQFNYINQIFKQLNSNQTPTNYYNYQFKSICRFYDTYQTKKYGLRHRIKFLINSDNYTQNEIQQAINQFKQYCQQNNIKFKIEYFIGGWPHQEKHNFINISSII